jgi:hypothetical protein
MKRRYIRTEVREEIKAARRLWLPRWAVITLIVLSIPYSVLFDHFGGLNIALPLFVCLAAFGLVIYIRWDLRRRPWFWTTIAVLAGLHALLIWSIPWTSKWVPAAAFAGLSSLDFVLMLWVLAAFGRLLGETGPPKGEPKV